MTETNKKFHFAWMVMIGCGLMIAGTVTMYTVVIGNFFVAASEGLGVDYTSIALYSTFLFLGIAAGLPFVGNLLPKIPPLGLAGLAAIQSIMIASLSFSQDVMFWWIAGAIIGFGMGFTGLVGVSTLLTNWFHKKTGFAMGMSWGIASLLAAIMSPVCVELIANLGWREAILIYAAVGAIFAVPAALFLAPFSPERKGLKPYGYEEGASDETQEESVATTGATARVAVKSLPFILIGVAVALTQIVSGINLFFPVYADSVGFAPTVGALMISVALIFDIILNPIIGITIDKFGAVKAFVAWWAVAIASFIVLMFSAGNEIMAYLGAGLGDTMYVLLGVGVASVTSAVFGTRDYGKILAYIVIIGFAVGSVGSYIITYIFELTGSFDMVFIVLMVMIAVICLAVIVAQSRARSLGWAEASKKEAK